jgi:hypothetical protein
MLGTKYTYQGSYSAGLTGQSRRMNADANKGVGIGDNTCPSPALLRGQYRACRRGTAPQQAGVLSGPKLLAVRWRLVLGVRVT